MVVVVGGATWCGLHAPGSARAARGGTRRRSLREGDRGAGAGRPRASQRPHSRGAWHPRGDGQAPPGKRLPEDRGTLKERGGEDALDGAVDRPRRDHLLSRRFRRLLWRLTETSFT